MNRNGLFASLLLLLTLGWVGASWAAVAFDAASEGRGSASPVTISHTTSGSDRVLYVQTNKRGAAVTGVTYGGVAMTQIDTTIAIGNSEVRLWRLINPASGANNVVVTMTSPNFCKVEILSVTGADQTTPEGTISQTSVGGATSISQTVTIPTDGISAQFGAAEDTTAPANPSFTSNGTNQTERTDGAPEGYEFGTSSTQTGSGSVSAQFTFVIIPNGGLAMFNVPINAATGGAAMPNRLMLLGVGP